MAGVLARLNSWSRRSVARSNSRPDDFQVSGRFVATATEKAVILELPPLAVQDMVPRDHTLGANFFWTLCQVEGGVRERE